MLKNLTRVILRRVGFHTDNIQKRMTKFHPKTIEDITSVLKTISLRKQYIKDSHVTQSFINRIQHYVFDHVFNSRAIRTMPENSNKNPKPHTLVNQQVIKIYKIMKSLGLNTYKFKHGLYKYLAQLLIKSSVQGIPISSNQLQKAMWFIYQQFPFLRDTKFQEICSDYTLRLFQIIQYMNKLSKLPSWQPYIRIAVLLQTLGHQPQLRSDVNLKTIQQVSYLYYPYFPTVMVKTKQLQDKLLRNHKIQQNFNIYLCNKYLKKDKLRYDKYIFYVQQIDNEQSMQGVEKTIDPLTWYNYTQLFNLYTQRSDPQAKILDNDLSYEMCQLFWRLHQSSQIQLQCGIKILKMLCQNQHLIDLHMERVIKRIVNSLQDGSEMKFRFLAGNAFIQCLQSIRAIGIIPQIKKDLLYNSMIKKANHSIMWEQGQKQDLLNFIQDKKLLNPEEASKHLKI